MVTGENGSGSLPVIDTIDLPASVAFGVAQTEDSPTNRFADHELSLLSPGAVPNRVNAFRLGREAAHRALGQLGRDDRPISTGPNREPIWPPGVVGSISHTSEAGVALTGLLTTTVGLGIDIEARRHAPELRDQVPRPEERSWLNAHHPDEQEALLFALFSAKESIFKAFFPRVERFFGFEAASLKPIPGGFEARLVAPLDQEYPPDRTFTVGCKWEGDVVLTWVILPPTASNHRSHNYQE